MHDPRVSDHGWNTIKDIFADLKTIEFVGLLIAGFLTHHGHLTAEQFLGVFAICVGGMRIGGMTEAWRTVRSSQTYSRQAVQDGESRSDAGGQGGDRSGLPQQGR